MRDFERRGAAPVTPPAPFKKGGRRTRRGEMRSYILLLTGALHEAMTVAVKSAHDARIYNGNDDTSVSYIHLNTKTACRKFLCKLFSCFSK